MIGKRPLYVVKIGDGYYSETETWQSVPKARATLLTHKEARRVRDHLRRPGIRLLDATVEATGETSSSSSSSSDLLELPRVGKSQHSAKFYKRRDVGPNKPCQCGSGKKFKKCCQRKPVPNVAEVIARRSGL